ncbi:hypothetical protein BG006_000067 [Podila minutissima]|uniref:XPG-I domain-containing protein n=1 Tax=Podila minutissima TaxID=64525 RepID=A0A9P5VPS6_9FUNG|nr:hypothetical protein BG006_000067 [Podila minutissima]
MGYGTYLRVPAGSSHNGLPLAKVNPQGFITIATTTRLFFNLGAAQLYPGIPLLIPDDAYTHNSVNKAHEILEEYEIRNKAEAQCEKSLIELKHRIDNNIKPCKQHFTNVKTNLATTFYWTLTMHKAFIHYMQEASWKVQMCETEADLAIAQDCEPDDIVISADSDMLVYSTISTLWHPVSRSIFLVYELEDVRHTLSFTKAQLTALAVISKNDYGKNIYSLGPTTNYSIIKSIQGKGTRDTIAEYLCNPQVMSKNKEAKTFELAIHVFVDMKQTPVTSDLSVVGPSTYDALLQARIKSSISTPHSLAFNTRQLRDMKRPPPEKMKLYKFKPYKERMDTTEDVTNNESTKSKAKAKPMLKTLEASSAPSRKLSIMHLMAYQHPTSSLGVGTLWANTGCAVQNDSILQGQVVQCVQDAVCDATSTKCKGQCVIGCFIEHINCMGPQLDDANQVFLDLLCPRVTEKDAQCYKDGVM